MRKVFSQSNAKTPFSAFFAFYSIAYFAVSHNGRYIRAAICRPTDIIVSPNQQQEVKKDLFFYRKVRKVFSQSNAKTPFSAFFAFYSIAHFAVSHPASPSIL